MKLPVDFTERMEKMLGDEYKEFEYCYDNDNYQGLRINSLKVRSEDYSVIRGMFGCVEQVEWEANGFYYDGDTRPGKHPFHEMGLYYIQEPSAMSAAAMLKPQPGMRVLDLCAAPGGKSTQLASYLSQQGLLVANEINGARAKILSLNIERLGIKNAIVTNEDSGKLAGKFPGFFHAVLVDAPCSGEGMFRKNAEAIGEWSLDNVRACAQRQAEIMDNAATMLMPGGTLVYSTCTFAEEENEMSIQHFLERHPEFQMEEYDAPWFSPGNGGLKGTFRLWPHKLHGEGHFAAILRKSGSLNTQTKSIKDKQKALPKDKLELVREFACRSLTKEMADSILSGPLVCFGEQLYLVPSEAPGLNGIRVLRNGLHIGEFKKNRFEPSHALALAMSKQEATNVINLSLHNPESLGFFRGESVMIPEGQEAKGWTLVCIEGYSAGWGKASNGMVKNHYPKGLRKELKCDTMCKVKGNDSVK